MDLLGLLHDVADAAKRAIDGVADRGEAGTKAGQHHTDIAADAVAVEMLTRAGLGVLSEESGMHHADRDIVVAVDPLDGSTNAARGIPWWATSLCAVDGDGPLAAVVVDQASGTRYEATRGGGARRDGDPIAPTSMTDLARAIVGITGAPPPGAPWRQFRAFGAIALDLCAVADGRLDGYVDCAAELHGPWDYLGALLVCREVGVTVSDARDRELVALDHRARRTPVAGATPALHLALTELRQTFT